MWRARHDLLCCTASVKEGGEQTLTAEWTKERMRDTYLRVRAKEMPVHSLGTGGEFQRNAGGSKTSGSLLPSLKRWVRNPQKLWESPCKAIVLQAGVGGYFQQSFSEPLQPSLRSIKVVAFLTAPLSAVPHVCCCLTHLSHSLWNTLPRDVSVLLPFYAFRQTRNERAFNKILWHLSWFLRAAAISKRFDVMSWEINYFYS